MFPRSFRRFCQARKTTPIINKAKARRASRLQVEQLEIREVLTAFTPGNLIILQAGNNTTQYNTQGPLYLDEYTTTPGGSQVQQAAISATGTVGGTGNQPITIDLTAAAGNGQLNRTYDGAGLVFGGVDSTVDNGGYTLPLTPTGSANRVIAVVGNDPASGSFTNVTTYGPFYVGDDNRGGVADSLTGPVYSFGHPNQAGGAVSQGVLYFSGPNGDGSLQPPGTAGIGPQSGVQVSSQTNIRGGFIGFDNRLYWTTAGGATVGGNAGIYTSNAQALPNANFSGLDTPVVKALFSASKVGGMFLADVNGDGVVDNGDRIYLLDDGTVGGAGTGGLYMSVFDTTRWGGGNAVTGQAPGWSPMVRIAEGVIDAQPNPQSTAQLRGLAGTVLSDGSVQLYATEFDNVAGNNSYAFGWNDATGGVQRVASASESSTTVTITLSEALPASIRGTTTWLSVNSVGTAAPTSAGYNGVWNATIAADGLSFTYTNSVSGLASLSGSAVGNGTVGQWLNTGSVGGSSDPQPVPASSQIIQTLADGTLTASPAKAQLALRGVSFAPVSPTTLSNFLVDGLTSETVAPGTNVTFTVHVANPQAGVVLTNLKVTFIDLTTNTIIGQGTINGSGDASFTTSTALVGNHIVSVYFAGGGAQALASAKGTTTVTVNEAGSTASSTSLAATIGGASTSSAAIGRTVTFTATVTGSGATGTVSFYNGSVTPANLIGSAPVSSGTAVLNFAFSVAGSPSITAVYNGDATFAASTSSSVGLTIAANATAAITTSANNTAVGATPTYTATLTGSLGTVAGTVQFFIDGTALGAVQTLSSGVASVTSTALTAGSHLITISYTPAATSPYNAFAVTTSNSQSGTALIETARQPLTPGNLFAVQRGDGTVNLGSNGYLVFLDEYTPAGVLVQRIALPNADNGTTHALLLSGQNGAEGLLQQSGNGQYVTIVGYDTPVGNAFETSTQPYQFGRTIARIDAAGNVDTSTSITTSQHAITAASWSGGTVTITASNNLQVGDPVTISGMTPAAYNGTFTVVTASSSSFTYALGADPGTETVLGTATGPSVPFNPEDVVTNDGTSFWLASSTGTGDTTDSGILYATLGASVAKQVGPINHGAASVAIYGTASPQVAVVNRGSGELGAPQGIDNVGTGLPTSGLGFNAITSLTDDASGNVTVTTSAGPAMVTNNQVVISGASVAGYNGTWTVTGVNTGAHTFTFSGAPASLAAGSGGTASSGQVLSGFPNLQTEYANVFTTNRTPEQFVFLNTNDGSSNNPNLAYVADQAYGLLKFWKDGSGNWHLGQLSTNAFGEKLIFAGGATGVIATIVNPGTNSAKVNIYVTGSNVQQANPNQIAFFQDQNGAPAGTSGTGVDLGFSSGNFSTLAFVGGAQGAGPPSSPNGNMNFAGLAFVPGFVPGNLVVTQVGTGSGTLGSTATAAFIDQFSKAGLSAGSITLPINVTKVTPTNATWASGVATITAANSFAVGQSVVIAGIAPSGFNGTFTIVSASSSNFTYALPTSPIPAVATITAASWSSGTVTITANNTFAVGEGVTIAGMTPTAYNGTFTVVTASSTNFTYALAANPGTATGFGTATYATPKVSGSSATVSTNSLTEGGNATGEGFLTDSADGHTLSIAGYNQAVGGTTGNSSENRVVGLINAAGVVDTTTQLPQQTSSTRVAMSADGLGFWVATSSGVRYVPFGNSVTVAPITAASWSSGVVTITANNNFAVGQTVSVSGITPTGYNGGAFTVLSASGTGFTYALNTNPGSTTSLAGATANVVLTQVTNEVSSPNAVGIDNGTLYASAGAGAQSNGVPALDSQFVVSGTSPLATNAGQAIVNPSLSFPTARDTFNNFPSSNQFWVSPDGNTILIADSRTDSLGGLLEYFDVGSNVWILANSSSVPSNLNSFNITDAIESGTTVTITYSGGTGNATNDFPAGQRVEIDGFTAANATAYNGQFTITPSTSNTFTYTSAAGLPHLTNTGVATSVDGGLRALVVDDSTPTAPVVYATTTGFVAASGTTNNGSQNRLVKITGVTLDGSTPNLVPTVLSTAPANTAYRGVAFAPTNPGTTASTTALAVTNNPATYGTGVTLTATVTPSGATGWVSFRNSATGAEIGAAPVVSGTAQLVTKGNLFAAGSAYNIVATYTGDSTFAPSTSSAQSATVNKANTTTAVTLSTNPVSTIATETITATIAVPAGTNPTGTVTFFDGGTQIGTPQQVNQVIAADAVTFTATLPFIFTTVATHVITAQYNGDQNFNASAVSPAVNLVVVNPTTVVVSTTNVNPVGNGGSITLSAVITSPDTTDTITGSVQFYDNLLTLGSAQSVSGVSGSAGATASITVSTALLQAANKLTPGLHSITAVYTPDSGSVNTFFTGSGVYEQAVQDQTFMAGDQFVFRVGDGTTNLIAQPPNPIAGSGAIGSTIYIDEYSFGASGTISSATESGTTVTINTSASLSSLVAGTTTVVINGITTTGYNGNYVVQTVGSGNFTVTAATGLTTPAVLSNATWAVSTLVQSIILPSADGQSTTFANQTAIHAIVGNGQQSATGQMSLSTDGQYLFVTGYDNNPLNAGTALPVPTANGSANVNRSVARIKYDGTIQDVAMTPSNAGSSFGNFNAVYSPDGNQFYVAGNGGVSYFSSFSPAAGLVTPTVKMTSVGGTTTALEPMGSNLALVGPSSTFGNPDGPMAFSGFPTAATSPSSLPGFSDAAATAGGQATNFYIDAYFTHLNGSGAPAGINTFYLSDDGVSFAHGAITKWALVSGTWQAVDKVIAGTGNAATSFYYLNGSTDATGNVTLDVTYGNGGNADTGPGFAYQILDKNGYNKPIGIDGTNHSDALTTVAGVFTGSNEVIRGMAGTPLPLIGSVAVNGNKDTFTIASASESGSTVTITTQFPNDFVSGNQVVITGVGVTGYNSVDQAVSNVTGAVTITVVDSTHFTYTSTTSGLAPQSLGGQVQGYTWAIASTSQPAVATVTDINEPSGTTATVTTGSTPHGFAPGDTVVISTTTGTFNGTYTVQTTPTTTTFTITTAGSALGDDASGGTATDLTVTATMSGPFGLIAGQKVQITGVNVGGSTAQNAYDGTFTIKSVVGDPMFTYDAKVNVGSGGTGGMAANALGGRQRSMVNAIEYKFNQQVTLAGGGAAFTIAPVSGPATISTGSVAGTTVTINTTAAHNFHLGDAFNIVTSGGNGSFDGNFVITTIPSTTSFTYTNASATGTVTGGTVTLLNITANYTNPSGDLKTYVLTFSVPAVPSAIVGGSITDGGYNLTVNLPSVTLVSNGAHPATSDHSADVFYRLFGDSKGTGSGSVNSLQDAARIKKALGSSANDPASSAAYVAYFDYDLNGTINSLVDYSQFKKRLGQSLSGFTPTI